MNLLENCIFSATPRVDHKIESLCFDNQKGSTKQKLTVAFSSKFGRPTSTDDLILLALMKLSYDAGLTKTSKSKDAGNRRIYFTRYQIAKLLKWPDNGESNNKIWQFFDRIRGTHLDCENSFRDNRSKSWVSRKFSIIDDVYLYNRENYDRPESKKMN